MCLSTSLFTVLVVYHIANAQQCSSGRNVEFSVDGTTTTTTVYKPIGSSFIVRCRKCTGSGRPSWFHHNQTEISTSCGSDVSLCAKNADLRQATDLIFSSLTKILEGEYQCTKNQDRVIDIKVFG